MGCQCLASKWPISVPGEQLAYTGRQYCTLRVANSQSESVDGQGLCHDRHVDKTDWLGRYDGVLDPNSSVDASPSYKAVSNLRGQCVPSVLLARDQIVHDHLRPPRAMSQPGIP
eukprot:2002372-Rhodomonas_salina.1